MDKYIPVPPLVSVAVNVCTSVTKRDSVNLEQQNYENQSFEVRTALFVVWFNIHVS